MKQEIINLPHWLQGRFIILVGLMGAGKTKLGRIVASSINIPFIDTDAEIEKAAGYTVQEIFDRFGEKYFRDGEHRVIKRILCEQPAVLATGGGAYMNLKIRNAMNKQGITIWLRADLDLLVQRTKYRSGRPLLNKGNARKILAGLIAERYPVYAQSELVIDVSDEPASKTAKKIIDLLTNHDPKEDSK